MLSRRALLALLAKAGATTVILAGAASVPGCSATLSLLPALQPSVSPEKVQLVYQDWRTDWFPDMARRALERFHDTHPNIRVYYTPDPDDVETRMLTVMQAGSAPDVFQGCCTHFPIWAQSGFTVDLRPYTKTGLGPSDLEDWDPAQYEALFLRDGRQFGLPKYHGALALYYNRDLFDRLGVA